MDDRRFDALARRLGGSRRRFLKQALGLGGVAAVGRLTSDGAEAARRGYSGPRVGATPRITIVFDASPTGGCIPHGRLSSFPAHIETQATWYVMDGGTTLGPYYGEAITDANGFGDASFPQPPIAPGPDVSVRVEVTGVSASAPVSCSS